jgi:AcrR family transcriptional regulator
MSATPAGRTRRTRPAVPLNRDRVVATAMEIADARGAGAVTMRAVASRLGVEAMSLYNHVASKDDLFDGMIDRVIEQVDLPEDAADWSEALRRRAVSSREVFERHPWAPRLLDTRTRSGPTRLRYLDHLIGMLLGAGFSTAGAARAISLLDSYVYGFGIQQANFAAGAAAPGATGTYEGQAREMLASVSQASFPFLHRMASDAAVAGYDAEADFGFGLGIILDGLRRVLHEGAPGIGATSDP